MADNVAVTPGTGATIATDDVGGVQYQRVKVDVGGDGLASPLVRGQQTGANSIPVVLPSDQAAIPVTDNSSSLTVDNGGTFVVQENGAALTALQLIDNAVGTPGSSAGTGAFTVQGNLADNAVNSGASYPVIVGGNATTAGANLPTYSNNDIGQNQYGTRGALNVQLMVPNDQNQVALMATNADDVAVSSGNYRFQVGAFSYVFDGTGWDRTPGNSTDGMTVNLGANNDVTVTGTVTANLAAGTNNIGDVDVLTVPADPFGANADAASATGSISAKLRFIASTGIPITGTVTVGSHAVTNAGTFAVQVDGSALTALQKIDDPVIVDDAAFTPATSSVMMMGAQFDNVATDSVDEGDAGAVRMSANRNLYVNIRDNAGNERGLNIDANGALAATVTNATASNLNAQIVGTAAKDAPVSGNPVYVASRASAAAPSDVSADDDVVPLWLLRSGAVAVQPTFAGVLGVAGNGGVGTGVQRVTLANDSTGVLATVSTVTTLTGGGVAHDSGDSGNPIKVGAKAITALSGATLVASADRTDNQSDLDGALLIRENGTLADYVNGNASNTDGSSTQVLAAGAAGVKHYITDVTITNTSSSNIYVELKDNTTVKWTFPVPANGGVTHSFKTPLAGTAATAWNFDPSSAATTVYCSVAGFKSKI